MFDQFRYQPKRERDADGDGVCSAGREGSVVSATASVVAIVKSEPVIKRARNVRVVTAHAGSTATACVSTREDTTADQAPQRSKWQERWHAICSTCFHERIECTHYPEQRLRLLIVGHNPSDHAWESGFSYSNPSNRMWSLLCGRLSPLSWRGILPTDAHVLEQNSMPHTLGVGMTSIGLEPGNDAASYGKETMSRWRVDFFRRLRRHVARVCAAEHAAVKAEGGRCRLPHSPMLIAFSGKRQFSWLFSPPLAKVEHYGRQSRLPPDWPHECLHDCEVWVLPSSSGRAAMTTEQRAGPYRELADRMHDLSWTPLVIDQVEAEPDDEYSAVEQSLT